MLSELPAEPSSTLVADLFRRCKEDLGVIEHGTVGIVFTVHDGYVVGYEPIYRRTVPAGRVAAQGKKP